MPHKRVNVRASAQEDGTSFAPLVLPRRVNIPDDGVGPLINMIIGAFQRIPSANPTPAPVIRGLLLEHFWALGGKEFSRVKGTNLTVSEYWLEEVERILEQMSYSEEEKLGYVVSLLYSEAYHWWNTVRRGIVFDRMR
ncbi:hypothetical protein V6Z11_D06G178200 [Gossypium hirsutum]